MMVSNQKVKALLFTLILAFIAIGTITVAAVMKNEKPVEVEQVMVMDTWYFNGTDPLDKTHYSKNPNEPNQCKAPFQTVCEIVAPESENSNEPDLQAIVDGKTVEEHIQDALDALPSNSAPQNPVVSAYRPTN